MSAVLMSRDGLNGKVQYSAQDFVIWMQSLEEMTVWSQSWSDAADKIDANFAAIVGTPVPAVIGTDYQALKRMCEKKTDLPILAIDTDGMELYDKGEEKAYLALFTAFAKEKYEVCKEKVGILGMTPQDVSDLKAADKVREKLKKEGKEAICYGMGDGLEAVERASEVGKNIVVSAAALEAAKYLEKTFGTPYEIGYPAAGELVPNLDYQGKKILVVHQQVMAEAIRQEILKRDEFGRGADSNLVYEEKRACLSAGCVVA